jgi:hypothetical protein
MFQEAGEGVLTTSLIIIRKAILDAKGLTHPLIPYHSEGAHATNIRLLLSKRTKTLPPKHEEGNTDLAQ